MSSKLNYWAVHYEKWKTSGLNQSDFCKQNNLKYHTFCYWRDRVRKQAMELPSQTKPFLPVKVVHPEPITPKHPNNLIKAAIQITLSSGIAVDIHNHADASLVCQMLKMLSLIFSTNFICFAMHNLGVRAKRYRMNINKTSTFRR